MKKILGFFGVFLLFMVVAIGLLAVMPPERYVRAGLAKVTRDAGVELRAGGPLKLRLLPTFNLHMEDVSITREGKPIASAASVDARGSFIDFIWRSHRIAQVTVKGLKGDLEIGKDGRPTWLGPPATRGGRLSSNLSDYSVGTLELTGANLSYRDQRNGLAARLDGADVTLKEATLERFTDALVKATSATLTDPARGTTIEVAGLDATASEFSGSRVRELSSAGTTLVWRDAKQQTTAEAGNFKTRVQGLGLDSAGPLTFDSASLVWRDPATGTLNASNLAATAKGLKGGRLEDVAVKSGTVAHDRVAGGALTASNIEATAKGASAGRLEDVAFKSSAVAHAQAGGTLNAANVAGTAKSVVPDRIEGIAALSSRVAYAATTRAPGAAAAPAFALEQASFAAPVLAAKMPVESDVAFVWNKERVAGKVRLPTPEALAAGPTFPAAFALAAAGSSIDFDGSVSTAGGGALKGTAKATTGSIEALTKWLGMTVPATVRGTASLAGTVDAQPTRIAVSNGRIAHGANAVAGNVVVDIAGARPRVSGKLAADKLDADAYLGLAPVKPRPRPQPGAQSASRPEVVESEVQLSDVFKTYVRGMLDAPPRRGATLEFPDLKDKDLVPAASRAKPKPGSFTWSEERFDLAALRGFDLDVDWTVKSLAVRGIELRVPQLKTHIDDGTLTLEGRDLGMKDGRVSGRAQVDARQSVPAMTATVQGTGVDFHAISEAFGIPPMLDGITAVEANIRSSGNSQKQLVQSLSGKVKTDTPQGNVIGYDLGSLNIFTLGSWISGRREYDPERRTPINGLKTDLDIKNGVVHESQVTVGGPILGVNAEGTIELIDQRLDYSGRARISSLLSGLGIPFKLFGDWSRPSFKPDISLASVFSRSAPGGQGMADIIAATDIKPDAELALLIGRVFQKAGPSGLDPATRALLEAVQKKALGN